MKRVRNTTEEVRHDPMLGMAYAMNIEGQERRGQSELVNSCQLPKYDGAPYRKILAQPKYEALGIKVIGDSRGDDLFVDVEMPGGWKKQATDHSMWNKLINDKGEEVAMFFYKAAFYDRVAFINFNA